MKRLAMGHQIIAISHLAQIAAFADAHYLSEKSVSKSSTSTSLRLLSQREHLTEVARLISGEEVSTAGMDAAEHLIRQANERDAAIYEIRR